MRRDMRNVRRSIRVFRRAGFVSATIALAACGAATGPGSAPVSSQERLLGIQTIIVSLETVAKQEAPGNPEVAQALADLDAAWVAYQAAVANGQSPSTAVMQAAVVALEAALAKVPKT